MCLPSYILLDTSSPPAPRSGAKQLLLDVEHRAAFGIGAAARSHTGSRVSYINEIIGLGLAQRDDYFDSGHPRFILTPCGLRAARLLREVNEQPLLAAEIIAAYDAELCPLVDVEDDDEDDGIDYHSYERWIEED